MGKKTPFHRALKSPFRLADKEMGVKDEISTGSFPPGNHLFCVEEHNDQAKEQSRREAPSLWE